MGWSHIKLEQYEAAIVALNSIIKNNTKSSHAEEAYFLLGQCYLNLNRYDEAIQAFDKIIELFPRRQDYSKYFKEIHSLLAVEEKKLQHLETDLLVQESYLLEAIPVDGYANKPQYLKDEQEKIEQYRASLVNKILEERSHLRNLRNTINKLREDAIRKYQRKDWRGYAEYGKARALFLKEMK